MSPPTGQLEGVPPAGPAQTLARLNELLGVAQEAARDMLKAEEALDPVLARFEQTEDAEAKGELAAEALGYVEHQLELTQARRRQLDGVEGKLWARRNDLERFLIRTRGRSWWHARRHAPQPEAAGRLR